MVKLKYDSGLSVANCIRAFVLVVALGSVVFKLDLVKLIFKKSLSELNQPQISETLSKQQVDEIIKIAAAKQAEDRQLLKVAEARAREEFTNEIEGRGDKKFTKILMNNDNRMYVPVTIGYRGKMITVPLLIDTGSTGVVITPGVAQRLGIDQNDTTQGNSTVADGRSVPNYNINVDFVAVGPKTKKPLQVHIIQNVGNNDAGLLGMSFLADFPHMIDIKSGVIKWL